MRSNCNSFSAYLFKDRSNKNFLLIAAVAIIIQFSLFKYFYPFISYIHGDSFVYIETASKNLPVNFYLIGYSMFLRAFSVFSTSDTFLAAFQYLSLQASALFLLFTLNYFYHPGKIIKNILYYFIVLNPLFLYMGNLVSSDALFLILSLIWFTLLLWIIHRPTSYLILWHTLIIFFAFTVRYNALVYLLISIVAFVLSHQALKRKIISILSSTLLIGLFIFYTGNQYKTMTGTWQYSPFAGWQLANNAMYTYRYVDSAERKSVPNRFKVLDYMIRKYFDSTRDVKKNPQEELMASTVYMWDSRYSLYKYQDIQFKNDSTTSQFKKWASMGPLYKDYGFWIIKNYPFCFFRYFLWPNSNKYYAPPVEFLSVYNSGIDSVPLIARNWFKYKSNRVYTRTRTFNIKILEFYPILSGMVNIVMLFGLISFSLLNGWQHNTKFRKGILLGSMVWLFNAGFTIFASSAALRFQAFPILLSFSFVCLLIDWLCEMTKKTDRQISKLVLSNHQLKPATKEL